MRETHTNNDRKRDTQITTERERHTNNDRKRETHKERQKESVRACEAANKKEHVHERAGESKRRNESESGANRCVRVRLYIQVYGVSRACQSAACHQPAVLLWQSEPAPPADARHPFRCEGARWAAKVLLRRQLPRTGRGWRTALCTVGAVRPGTCIHTEIFMCMFVCAWLWLCVSMYASAHARV